MTNDTPHERKENSTTDEAGGDAADSGSKPRRRIQDGITSNDPTGKLDLDRRYKNSERRFKYSSVYKGRARRFTIDRRKTTRDRRKQD